MTSTWTKWVALLSLPLLLLLACNSAYGQYGRVTVLKKILDGSRNQLSKDSAVTVQDSVYFNPVVQNRLDTPYPVRNIITFMLNEYSNRYLPGPFSATANLRIIYTKPDLTLDSVDKSLTINYDTIQSYNSRHAFTFLNAHKVTVKVLNVTVTPGISVLPALMIENEMDVQPIYKLSRTDDAIKTISSNNPPNTDSTDQITVNWPAVTGADEYDLEWAYVDSSALVDNRYGSPINASLVFRNNASRVTVADNSYAVPLLYNNGGILFYRVRAVQVKGKAIRVETAWSSDYTGGLGKYSFCGHQRALNWQASTSFAEEGKRKITVQYFDGSLRSRQTVTKDNSTNTTVVGESFYDYQGRPVIQVLPAPTLNTVVKYSRNFNNGVNGAEYDKGNYDYLSAPSAYPASAAKPMGTTSGAGQYYSANNPNKTTGIHRFIPDAQGYAFTETEYTQDNTGRISRQSGVGPYYKLGSGHETRYFYGTPSQEELDALFGTEAGEYTHYSKNMVEDANGQFSVSYVDMRGRTIATALASTPDSARLDNLPSNQTAPVVDTLSGTGANIVKDLVMESKKSQLVPVDDNYRFRYSLVPPVLQKKDCNNNTICYNSLYELEIIITDDAYNQHLGGKPFDTIVRNYTPGSLANNCNPPQPLTLDFTLRLPKGSYEITKRLKISPQGLDYYRDTVFINSSTCTTLDQFVQQQRTLQLNMQCVPGCQSCRDSVGTWTSFRANYMRRAGIPNSDTARFRGEAYKAFLAATEACDDLCNEKQSESKDFRTAMLLDVSAPSGQYANLADSADSYSIFYKKDRSSIPVYQQSSVRYLDEDGKPDLVYDESSDSYIQPQKLTPEQFADKFKASWAEALLPYHPEYCKLQEYLRHNASHDWDRVFEQTDTYAAAKSRGFLTPVASDPLAGESADLRNKLSQKYSNYQDGYSMWAMAITLVKCKQNDDACVAEYKSWTTAGETSLCTGDLDMIWRSFRQLYLGVKRDIIFDLVKNTSCPGKPNPTPELLVAAGEQPVFNNATGALQQNGLGDLNANQNEQAARDSANARLARSYDENCRSYVKMWIRQLAPCKYSAAALDVIIPKLIAICKEGSDPEHPFGASSVKPSSVSADRNFQKVLDEYNAANGWPNHPGCNSYLITAPAPYDRQPVYGSKLVYSKPDDCECLKLKGLNKEFLVNRTTTDANLSAYLLRTRKINVSQADLDLLLNSCTSTSGSSCTYFPRPVNIPAIVRCNTGPACVSCYAIDQAYTKFQQTYYGIYPQKEAEDTVQQIKNELFANYMNNQLGFNKQAWEYLAFMDSCQPYNNLADSLVCEVSQQEGLKTYDIGRRVELMWDVIRTSDNGYLMVGSVYEPSGQFTDGYLIKTNNSGGVQWAKTYGKIGSNDVLYKIKPTTGGGYIAIGTTNSYIHPKGDAFVLKLDLSGNVQWARAIGFGSDHGENGTDIIQLSNGNYAFSGRYDLVDGGTDWLAGVITSSGTPVWTRQISTGAVQDGTTLLEDQDTLLIVGNTWNGGYSQAGVVKLRKDNGELLNGKVYSIGGVGRWNYPGYIFKTADGYDIGLLNTDIGYTHGEVGLLKLRRDGSVISAGLFSRNDASNGAIRHAVTRTNDGGYTFAQVVIPSTSGGHFAYLNKITTNNTVSWSSFSRQQWSVVLQGIMQNPDGSFISVGNYFGKALLMQTSANGNTGCNDTIGARTYQSYQVTPTEISVSNIAKNVSQDFSINVTPVNVTPVMATVPCSNPDLCYTSARGPLLCGNADPIFENTSIENVNNCSDSAFFSISTGTELYKSYRDSIKGSFEADYINTALQAANREQFTVSYNNAEYHYTLYYYDQAGNLVKTVPPAGVVVNRTADWLGRVKAARRAGQILVPAHTMPSQYRFNTLNQVVAQQTPDAGISKFWYDRLGRLAVSQNAKQVGTNAYSYTLYDGLGRIAEVGEITNATAMTDAISRNATNLAQWINGAASTRKQITRTTYDIAYSPLAPVMNAKNLRNRVSWTAVYDAGADIASGNHAAASFFSYDIHGNVDTLIQDFKKGSMASLSNRFKKIVYDYDLISGKVNYVGYQPGQPDAFYHKYSYDAENRLVNVLTSHDSIYWENDAYYRYYKHGPLARTVLGQQQVQGMDYAYTLQGWLKGVNSTALQPGFDIGGDGAPGSQVAKDVFGFGLHYFGNRDYYAINNTVKPFADPVMTGASFRPLFNGNIAAMSVNLPSLGEALLYGYSYDVLNRLKAMEAQRNLNTTTNVWTPVALQDFKESVSYDANGNILTYNRNGNKTYAGKPLFMDALTYQYKPGKNQLDYIRDTVGAVNYDNDIDGQVAGNYSYDAISNLTKDTKEGINNIEWTVYGKIQRITKANGTIISYTYDASGNRISKDVNGRQTWYVRDATGNILSVYTNGDNAINNGNLTQTETNLYGSSRLGMSTLSTNVQNLATPDVTTMRGLGKGISIIFTRGKKLFELSNHLGNVLATVSDKKKAVTLNNSTIDRYEADIASAQDYYPFGMMMPGRNGHKVQGGFASGNSVINGYSIPAYLALNNRSGNQPGEYVASGSIDLQEGFESGVNDEVLAYIADGSYAGESGGGAGGGNSSGVMGGYRYGFNGKENDNEVKGEGNSLDFGARIYDPRVGHWLSVDPLQSKYPHLTPYHFAADDPINIIDVDGRDIIRITKTTTFFPRREVNDGFYIGGTSAVANTVSVIKAPGKDVFYYDVVQKYFDVHGGVNIVSAKSTQFFPNNPQSATGVTKSASNNLPFTQVNDLDFISLAKLSPQGLVDYLIKKDPKSYSNLNIARAGMKLEEGMKDAANALLLFEGVSSFISSAGKAGTLNTKDIHFMQSSARNATGEFTVLGNAEALRAGTLNPEVLRINVWQDAGGKIWTLDHRRLAAFKLSGLEEVPVNWASPAEVQKQMWKMTTTNGGTSMKLKLGEGESLIVK